MTPTDFTPLASFGGGLLIGLSAVLLMGLSGRIAGLSGILARLFPPYTDRDFFGRLAFVLGLIAAPLCVFAFSGIWPPQSMSTSTPALIIAGLLVGFGATWGNGCTSGHGICGLALLSPRSLIATLTFMTTAIITVLIMRYVM